MIMNERIGRQSQFRQCIRKTLRRVLVLRPYVDEVQLGAKAIADPLRFGQHLFEARGESARDGDPFV